MGDTGGESDDTSAVAAAFERAASMAATAKPEGAAAGSQGDGSSSPAIIVKKGNGDSNHDDRDEHSDSEALMHMLPSSCRQGVLCMVPAPPGGGDGSRMVVLLGSTLAGAGVFLGMDGAWFERVCACLALGPKAGGAAAAPQAWGR